MKKHSNVYPLIFGVFFVLLGFGWYFMHGFIEFGVMIFGLVFIGISVLLYFKDKKEKPETDNKNNVAIHTTPTKTENKNTNIRGSAPTRTAFTMWENGVFFSNGWFIYYDGRGNNSIISHKRARAFEEGYQRYQASMDVNRGGADYDCAYRNRGFTKKDDRYVYERFRVDNLIVGELAVIENVLVIPEKIGNTPINYIEDSAFETEIEIEEVVLHKNVKRIGSGAFKGCVNLRKITIPNEHIIIGASVFDNTALLSNEDVMYQNNTLIKVNPDYNGVLNIKEGTTAIADEAAKGCEGISEVVLPEGLVSIGKYSFMGCSGVQSIVFPESLQVIEMGAFSECANLQNIILPTVMDKIGSNSFGKCPLLEKVHLPDGITGICGIFSGCTGLKDVNIPGSVTKVSDFKDCGFYKEYEMSSAETLYVGNWLIAYKKQPSLKVRAGTVGIADMHWKNAKELCELVLPDSLKYIGYSAFENSSITSVKLPENLEFIDTSAFRGSKLNNVVIPKSVKKVEQWAFMRCENIETITIQGKDTEIIWPAITGRRDKKPIIIRAPHKSDAERYCVQLGEKNNLIFKGLCFSK